MADDSRSSKLKRLVAVQRHIEKISENELAETTKVRSEVIQSLDSVMDAISSTNGVHMVFSRHYATRFARLSVRDKQLAGMQEMLESQLMKERTKGDRLEEKMIEARDFEDREREEESLADMVDQRFASLPPASSKFQKP